MANVNSYTRRMPTPDRTSLDAIVDAARDLLEEQGLTGLTMNAVALRVGVRPPSLYKRVSSREQLVQLVAEATLTGVAVRLDRMESAAEVVNEFRRFGHAHPAAFQLVMTPAAGIPTARREFGERASDAMLRIGGMLAGEEHALVAARTLTAWATGFVSMELNGSFQLGGDIDEAWRFGVARLIDALTRVG